MGSDDSIGSISDMFDPNKLSGFDKAIDSQKESEKVREKFVKETSDQMKHDGASAKDPLDKTGISEEAKEEREKKAEKAKED